MDHVQHGGVVARWAQWHQTPLEEWAAQRVYRAIELSAPTEQCGGNAEDEPLKEDRSHLLVLQSTAFSCGCNGQGPLSQLSQTFPTWQFESACGIWLCRTIPYAHLLHKTVHRPCEEQIKVFLGNRRDPWLRMSTATAISHAADH